MLLLLWNLLFLLFSLAIQRLCQRKINRYFQLFLKNSTDKLFFHFYLVELFLYSFRHDFLLLLRDYKQKYVRKNLVQWFSFVFCWNLRFRLSFLIYRILFQLSIFLHIILLNLLMRIHRNFYNWFYYLLYYFSILK